jgi:hypothetical protein
MLNNNSRGLRASCAVGVLGAVLAMIGSARAQSVGHYRGYDLGSSVAAVSTLAGSTDADIRVIHARPVLMQDLQWRAPFVLGDEAAPRDPVGEIVFSFYDNQLFRLAIEYDRHRTEGMTDEDMIAAISTVYGPAIAPIPKARRLPSLVTTESNVRIAAWGDTEYSAVLSRSIYGTGFRMVVTAVRLDGLARVADAEAIRLDERDAPQRAVERQKKEQADTVAAQEKARLINRAAFRP